jgi:hypothetical protein
MYTCKCNLSPQGPGIKFKIITDLSEGTPFCGRTQVMANGMRHNDTVDFSDPNVFHDATGRISNDLKAFMRRFLRESPNRPSFGALRQRMQLFSGFENQAHLLTAAFLNKWKRHYEYLCATHALHSIDKVQTSEDFINYINQHCLFDHLPERFAPHNGFARVDDIRHAMDFRPASGNHAECFATIPVEHEDLGLLASLTDKVMAQALSTVIIVSPTYLFNLLQFINNVPLEFRQMKGDENYKFVNAFLFFSLVCSCVFAVRSLSVTIFDGSLVCDCG